MAIVERPFLYTHIFLALLFVGLPAWAHEFQVVDATGTATTIQPNPGRPTAVPVSGSQATIRVKNDGSENPGCTTTVRGSILQGDSMDFSGSATFQQQYISPAVTQLDVPITTTGKPGSTRITIRWSASGQFCGGNNSAVFDFNVVGNVVRLTSYEVQNPTIFGDPVNLVTGELTGPFRAAPDLFLGGPLAVTLGRY